MPPFPPEIFYLAVFPADFAVLLMNTAWNYCPKNFIQVYLFSVKNIIRLSSVISFSSAFLVTFAFKFSFSLFHPHPMSVTRSSDVLDGRHCRLAVFEHVFETVRVTMTAPLAPADAPSRVEELQARIRGMQATRLDSKTVPTHPAFAHLRDSAES